MAAVSDYPEAAVFDLDGVVTFTARVHAAAWKELFDEYLRSREQRFGEPFRPFDADTDYRAFVDGRPRYEGVRIFLESRDIYIPYGSPSDSPEAETISGLGNRKNNFFLMKVQELGVDVDQEAVRFIRELREVGVRIGLASSSKNAAPILQRVGLLDLFDQIVDGIVSERLGLHGKPQPDIFLKCLELLGGTDPRRAMVVEDAIAGVQAGRLGGFGLVLGVDRHNEAESLLKHGADLVIQDFSEITVEKVAEYFRSRAKVA
jgi:trehalose 6-phosphate phosphatase